MQSLKELRAENAARRLSNSRTANEEEVAGNPVPAAATAAATAPRAGRTLAPLTSTGSLLPSPAATPAADQEDAVQHEDREARRRRRLRRRREREQREKDDGENSKVPVDDNETVLSGASRTSTTAGEEVTGGRAAAAATAAAAADNAFAEQKGGVPSGRRESDSERQLTQEEAVPATEAPLAAERKALDTEKSGVDDAGVGPEKPQLSARRAPPQEKPKKKLTPLEARRARIEQQKRQEIEKARSSDDSPRFVGSEEPREAKSDARSKGGAVDSGSRRPSDDRDQRGGTTTTNQTGQPTKRSSGGGRGTATGKTAALPRSSEDEKEDSGTEHDPLLFPGSVAERKTEDEDDNGSGGGSQPESVNVEKNPGVENDKGTKGGGRADDTLRASTGETLADAAAGDSGRFQGMRSRMKKAGKGLLTKKSSTSSVPRRKKADDAALSGTGGKEGQPSETVEGTSSGDTLPEAGGEGMARGTEDGGEDEHGDQNQTGGPADDSDTASNDSVLSPRRSEVEKDNDFDTESDEGGKGRKKKWGRSKEKSSAEAPLAGDKEVTLGHVVDRKMREMGYIRKPAVDELKNRRSLRDRVAAEGAPEVHFIGEISGAEGFGSGISCRFRVEGGRHWTCLAGLEEGQTHVMHTDFGDEFAPWNHPIDLHYTTKSIQGWPRLMVQVWQLDTHGRNVLRGYGFRHLPSTPGFSEVSVPCWRPSGTMQEETAAFFLGVTPRLTAEDAVFNRAWDQRCRLVTLPAGTVWIHMNGLFCNLQDQGVDSLTT